MPQPRSNAAGDRHDLTRPSGLGAAAWLLPVALLLPAALMFAVAVRGLDRLYQDDAGVLRPQQLLPYGTGLRYGALTETGTAARARVATSEARWQRRARAVSGSTAVWGWPEAGGRAVVVAVVLGDDAAASARALAHGAVPGEQVRTWPAGGRAAVLLAVSPARGQPAAPSLLADREGSIRGNIRLQRALSLTAGAVLPAAALAVALFVGLLAVAVALLVVLSPLLAFTALTRRTPSRTARRRPGRGSPALVDSAQVGPRAEVVDLPRWRPQRRTSLLVALPLSLVALPAATASLWPGSLAWAGVLGLAVVLHRSWARGSVVALWLRRTLFVALLLGASNAVLGWPASPTEDRRVLVALATVAVCTVLLAESRRRQTHAGVGGGWLGLRWLLLGSGLMVLAASSVGLFLGSNGATDRGSQLQLKALALPGLIALPVVGRRLRGAQTIAQRTRLRARGAPEVLYLRSFVDDRLRVRSKRRTRAGLERWLPWPTERFEDVLLRGFERMGPVISIARPGTGQTELGAARDLVIGDQWLTAVEAEMDSARFITVVLGRGAGLRTELAALCRDGRLDRVCIVVPPVPHADAAERLTGATQPLSGADGWGELAGDTIEGRGEIVALVGIGAQRYIAVTGRRALASTYESLAAAVAAMVAEHDATVRPQRAVTPEVPRPHRVT